MTVMATSAFTAQIPASSGVALAALQYFCLTESIQGMVGRNG
jgi:hypothetical protein